MYLLFKKIELGKIEDRIFSWEKLIFEQKKLKKVFFKILKKKNAKPFFFFGPIIPSQTKSGHSFFFIDNFLFQKIWILDCQSSPKTKNLLLDCSIFWRFWKSFFGCEFFLFQQICCKERALVSIFQKKGLYFSPFLKKKSPKKKLISTKINFENSYSIFYLFNFIRKNKSTHFQNTNFREKKSTLFTILIFYCIKYSHPFLNTFIYFLKSF